jgi:uracil-DNA glycosylase
VNIFKEIRDDVGINNLGKHGELTKWAKSGVLLLNTVLTVRAGRANSHRGVGWEIFTDDVINLLNQKEEPVVFLLWGANAKSKAKLVTSPKHLVLTAAHPSPLSAYNGFFGCRHFSKTNDFLIRNNIEPVDWSID